MKAIWDVIKPWNLWQILIFGQPCERRLSSLLRGVVFVKFPRAPQPMLAYICLFPYQTSHVFMSIWILSWDYRVHNKVTIQFSLLWIGFPKWPTLLLVRRPQMQLMLLNFTLEMSIASMACHNQLFQTLMCVFLVTSGVAFDAWPTPHLILVVPIILELMVKQKW